MPRLKGFGIYTIIITKNHRRGTMAYRGGVLRIYK